MTIPSQHVHISERESDGTWEDCTFDSGLEWYRLCYDARKPATHAEAEALRRASGRAMTGGTNLGDLQKGVAVRYGKTLPALVTNRVILKPGQAAVRQGSMKAFGPSHRLSKWQTNFDGGHAVLEFKDWDGQLWWCDPLAPTSASVPVKVTQAEVDKYAAAFAGKAIVGTIQNYTKEAAVANLTSYLPGYTATVKPSSNIRSEPRIGATKLHTTTANLLVKLVGTVKGDVDPANGSNVWYEFFHDGRSEYTAKDNIIGITAPAPVAADDGYTKATQDAALAAQKTTLDAQTKTLIAAAVAAERARIKALLGI